MLLPALALEYITGRPATFVQSTQKYYRSRNAVTGVVLSDHGPVVPSRDSPLTEASTGAALAAYNADASSAPASLQQLSTPAVQDVMWLIAHNQGKLDVKAASHVFLQTS